MDADSGEAMRPVLTEAANAINRCTSLAQRILDQSRTVVRHPEMVSVNEIVSGMERILRRLAGRDVELIVNCTSQVGLVWADPQEIERVLVNLVVNARDAMPNGGRLTLETANLVLDHDDASATDVSATVGLLPGAHVKGGAVRCLQSTDLLLQERGC